MAKYLITEIKKITRSIIIIVDKFSDPSRAKELEINSNI